VGRGKANYPNPDQTFQAEFNELLFMIWSGMPLHPLILWKIHEGGAGMENCFGWDWIFVWVKLNASAPLNFCGEDCHRRVQWPEDNILRVRCWDIIGFNVWFIYVSLGHACESHMPQPRIRWLPTGLQIDSVCGRIIRISPNFLNSRKCHGFTQSLATFKSIYLVG